ncbi:hypothetical protein ACFLR1_02340 [Bacteroidota bacterium]
MSKPLTFLMLLSALLFTIESCRTDFTAESNAVNSLLGVVDNVSSHSGEIDGRLINQYVKDVTEKCQTIQQQMMDTISLEDAQTLVDFCVLSDHLANCLERKTAIDSEIVKTREQLFRLRTDLKERVAEKDTVNSFIEEEFLYVESLDEGMEQVVVEVNACLKTYAKLKLEIDRFLIALPEQSPE